MGRGGTRYVAQPVGHRNVKYVEFEASPERRRRAEAAAAAAGVGVGEVERHWAAAASAPDRTFPAPRRDAPYVYLSIARGGKALGRLIVELFEQENPRGARFFQARCCGSAGTSYRGSKIHRVLSGFAAYGGACGQATSGAPGGLGNLRLQHSAAGAVSLSVTGDEFLVTFGPARTLDPEHQVVGAVRAGQEVLRGIEECPTAAGDAPTVPLVVTDCGTGAANMGWEQTSGEDRGAAAVKEKSVAELRRESEKRALETRDAVLAGLRKRGGSGEQEGGSSKRAKKAVWALEIPSSSSSSSS